MSSNANSEDVVLIRLCFVWTYKQGPFFDVFQATLNANTRSFAITGLSFIKRITQLGKKTLPDFIEGNSKLKFSWAAAVAAVQH